MSDIVTLYVPETSLTTCLEKSENVGRILYKQNENYRTIANCMEHPEFRKLFDTYFSSVDEMRNILMFLKLYEKIEKSSPVTLSGYQKLSIMDNLMKNREFRGELVKSTKMLEKNFETKESICIKK